MAAYELNNEEILEEFQSRIETLQTLREKQEELSPRDFQFADELYSQFSSIHTLSAKQWYWVEQLIFRIQGKKPIYGSFNAVFIMFRLAASNGGLKQPRIRLISDSGRFILLSFNPEETSDIRVSVDGWAGHGQRKLAGIIRENEILPFNSSAMSEDVILKLQEFSLDPMRVAKACAAKLGVCVYCGMDLTDERSKFHGYGPVCAKNWGLEWEGKIQKPLPIIDLNTLFKKGDSHETSNPT